MEKETQPDSMATITMKAEYPPSEVYSASEPPPAYRQRAPASVQIARIAALTVVASAFILGSFILASSWVSARASCRQLEQLDAMLDKELALEGRAYGNDALLPDEPLPVHNAHALRAAPLSPAAPQEASSSAAPSPASLLKEDILNQAETKIDENKLQSIDKANKNELPISDEDSSDSDSSMEEEDLDVFKPLLKLPLHFDLDELASTFLSSNQKGRMNCMMERRSEDPLERRFPFNILGAFAPRASGAERVAIICRGGDETSRPLGGFPEPQSQVFAFPLTGPMRLPLRPQPPAPPAPPALAQRAPFMPEHRAAPFMPLPHHRPAPFPLSMPWESSEEQAPQMRIHVQRVIAVPAPAPAAHAAHPAPPAVPAQHNMPPAPDAVSHFALPPPPMQPQPHHEQATILHQFVPQPAPTQELEQPEMESSPVQISLPWGELQAIRQSAEDARRDQQIDNDMQEDMLRQVKTIVNTIAAAAQAEAVAQAQEQQQRRQAQEHQRMMEVQRQAEEQRQADEQRPQVPQQADEPRSEDSGEPAQELPQPPRAPRTIMLPQDLTMDQRPHFMQPRSVRIAEGTAAGQ